MTAKWFSIRPVLPAPPPPHPRDRWQHLETFLVVTTEELLLASGA